MTPIIRKAKPADADALLAYLQEVGSESDNLLFGSEGVCLTPKEEAEIIRRMNASQKSVLFVAVTGDEIIGTGSFQRLTPLRLAHRGSLALAVRRDYWGQGIGTALLETLIDFATDAGVKVLELDVRSDNKRAITLYEKVGFATYGAYSHYFCINGNYYDALRMQRIAGD